TADEVLRLKGQYPVELIKREKRLGIGSAYLNGFKYALEQGADLIFEMDADLSHQSQAIPQFLKAAENADVVIGSRKIPGGQIIGWGLWRQFCSAGAMWFSRLILGLKTRDVTSGFRCYKREALNSFDLSKIKSNGYAFQEELIWLCEKNNCKIKEIPITFIDRQSGKSKLTGRDVAEFFSSMVRLKLDK
ncbi:MAG TPA: polyprenol monophosphomannose synthase, partial [Patescibacteria group bacterium]